MSDYSKDNKSCPRCGDLVGEILSRGEILVGYLSMKRYAKTVKVFCHNCGLIYEEEDRNSSTSTITGDEKE